MSRTCSVEECQRPFWAKGWCQLHYSRMKRWGVPEPEGMRRSPGTSSCEVDGCRRPYQSSGLCGLHSSQRRRQRGGSAGTCCQIQGCDEPEYASGCCHLHYQRVRAHGDADTHTRSGEDHTFWTGDDCSYMGAHKRVRRTRGSATAYSCVDCGQPADHWSYGHTAGDRERREALVPDGPPLAYSPNPEDYSPRCVSCHKRFDNLHERLMDKVVVDQASGCWVWTGAPAGDGRYGQIKVDGRNEYVHRVSYQLHVGPIPEKHEVDHVRARGCVSTLCISPAHLEPVLHRENFHRSTAAGATTSRTGVCGRGHCQSAENVYVNPRTGEHQCRPCKTERTIASNNRKKIHHG